MKIEKARQDKVVILTPQTEVLDYLISGEMKASLLEVFKEGDLSVILNMGNILQVRSAGIGLIISTLKTLNEKGGHLRLCNLGDNAKELFELCKLNQKIDIYDTESEAMESLNSV